MKTTLATFALATLAALPAMASAQQAPTRFELRPFIGAYVPTGDQKDALETGFAAGVQTAFNFNRYLSAVGSLGWASSKDARIADDESVELYQYDIGAELGIDRQIDAGMAIRPYIGAGIGGRSYDYRNRETDAQHNLAGYGAAGAQLQLARLTLRLEARDYISGFRGLNGEYAESETRNDLMLTTAIGFRF